MTGGLNPQLLMALLKAKGPMGAAGAATGTGAGEDSIGPATRELEGANPDYALKLVSEIKKQVANMIPTLAFRAPGAARALSSCFKGLDAALKELQQAQATLNAVGSPIKSSAVPTPQPPGATGAPSLPNPANVSM